MNRRIAAAGEESPRSAPAERDPFCAGKNLRSWASSAVISRGRDYYREGAVLSLEFASLFGARSPESAGPAGKPVSFTMRLSQDPNGVHLSIPPPAVDILKGFRPLLEMILKAGS